jgi:hypothetical protein
MKPSACTAKAKPFIAAETVNVPAIAGRGIARHGCPFIGRRGKHGELKRDEAQVNASRHKASRQTARRR